MHILTIYKTVAASGCDLLPGKYVTEDLHGAQLMLFAGRKGATLEPYVNTKTKLGGNILLSRIGSYGDLLLMTPAIKEIKRRYPESTITVACLSKFQPILMGSVDACVDFPVKVEDLDQYDCVVCLENTIEGNDDSDKIHAIDAFAKQIGLDSLQDRTLSYTITDREKEWANTRYPRTEKKRVAVQFMASSRCRNYPQHHLIDIILKLSRKDVEVFLIGDPMQLRAHNEKNVTNLMLEGLDIRQSIAAMATCDVLLGPDSVMLHVASAIGMNAIGLFGPVHWSNRSTSEKLLALQGNTGCTPCNYIVAPYKGEFPAHCPSAEKGYCALLDSIKPDRVLAKIQLLLK